jgi:hypothetical protein
MGDFLTEKDVAKQISVSLASLRRWRLLNSGPRFVKVGALVRYRPEDLKLWMDSLPAGGATNPGNRSAAESGGKMNACIH